MLAAQISPVLMIGGDVELGVWFKKRSVGVDAIIEDVWEVWICWEGLEGEKKGGKGI